MNNIMYYQTLNNVFMAEINFLPDDVIAYLLSFIDYDPKYFLINKRFNKLYHLSHQRYGINIHEIKILYHVEISDHEGYCSGAENEYSDEIYYNDIIFNKKYYSCYDLLRELKNTIIEVKKFCDNPDHSNIYRNQLKYLIPELHMDSGYCHNSSESIEHQLDIHDYRISIITYFLN